MFELTDKPIDGAALHARLLRPDAGALVVFEGWVRNHHAGRPVDRLAYEAYDELARLEGEAVVAEAERDHPGCHVLCVHRTGTLAIGETAVWIGAASAHRPQAFRACRQVIEELKRRVPIWKKEFHPDGAAEWVNAATPPTGATDYYARQTALPEVGEVGQQALAAARVLVVGVGGLGCPATLYLAGGGVGHLTIVDDGLVETSNLPRQILFTPEDTGAAKATAAATRLRLHNPFIAVEGLAARVTAANVRALVTGRTVVLDCTDNFATRFLLHDACRDAGVPLVQAGVHRYEGELNVFAAGLPGCLHCLWPGVPTEALDEAGNCASGPVFPAAVGVLGLMQASTALQLVVPGLRAGAAQGKTQLVDLRSGTSMTVERPANPACPVCASVPRLTAAAAAEPNVVLTAEQAQALSPAPRFVTLLLPGEAAAVGATSVAANDWARLRDLAATDRPLVLSCRTGVRSAGAARALRLAGYAKAYALAGPARAQSAGAD